MYRAFAFALLVAAAAGCKGPEETLLPGSVVDAGISDSGIQIFDAGLEPDSGTLVGCGEGLTTTASLTALASAGSVEITGHASLAELGLDALSLKRTGSVPEAQASAGSGVVSAGGRTISENVITSFR